MLKAVEHSGEDISEGVRAQFGTNHFVLVGLQSSHQIRSMIGCLQDMSHFGQLHSAWMDLDAQGQKFCSALPFKTWYELLVEEGEELVNKKKS